MDMHHHRTSQLTSRDRTATDLARHLRSMREDHWDASLEWNTQDHPTLSGPFIDDGPTGALLMAETVISNAEADYPAGDADAELVARLRDGDRDAMAELYDRYADRIHTMCVHMLRDEDEAADVTGQVVLTALQRIDQLRDPRKLRPWLFAITRNEVYRRTRHRSRVQPIEEVDDMSALTLDPTRFTDGPDATAEVPAADQAALAEVIQVAAGGLDERDRVVLELNLTQGLDGAELADALGVKVDNAYQLTHRMKERLERSIAALLVVRAGRDLCPDLDGVAKKWDGHYDVLWRKRFARHVERCERCERMRSRLPKAVLAGTVLSQAAQSAVLAAPISVRDRVLAEGAAALASDPGPAWSRSGFPSDRRRRPRLWQLALGALVAVLVVFGMAGALGTGQDGDRTSTTPAPTASVPTTVATTLSTTTAPPPTEAPSTTARPATTTTAVRRTTTTTTTSTTTTTTSTTTSTTTTTIVDPKTPTPPRTGKGSTTTTTSRTQPPR